MTSKQLSAVQTTPISIEVDEANDRLIVILPLCGFDTLSESGKMNVLGTTNGWQKTEFTCPRTAEKIQVNLFVGTRA